MKQDMLNQKAAAQFLGVVRWTLWKWHACGIGPPRFQVGRRFYYSRSALRQWQADLTAIAQRSAASADGSQIPALRQTSIPAHSS